MGFLYVDTGGLNLLYARLLLAQERVPQAVQEGLDELSVDIITELADAAPKGTGEGPPPPGDADGPLADSFESSIEASGYGARLRVTTTQPTKLKYVVEGRGPVYPVKAKALYWAGLDHPVKSAGPSQPNDFVTPVLEEAVNVAEDIISASVAEAITVLEG